MSHYKLILICNNFSRPLIPLIHRTKGVTESDITHSQLRDNSGKKKIEDLQSITANIVINVTGTKLVNCWKLALHHSLPTVMSDVGLECQECFPVLDSLQSVFHQVSMSSGSSVTLSLNISRIWPEEGESGHSALCAGQWTIWGLELSSVCYVDIL